MPRHLKKRQSDKLQYREDSTPYLNLDNIQILEIKKSGMIK